MDSLTYSFSSAAKPTTGRTAGEVPPRQQVSQCQNHVVAEAKITITG